MARDTEITPELIEAYNEAQSLQAQYWDALSALESELGCEVDGTSEFHAYDTDTEEGLAQLKEWADEHEDEDEDDA